MLDLAKLSIKLELINMPKLIGRRKEIAILDRLFHSNQAEFLAVYGRRRIGKTFLINQYFRKKGIFLEITGSKNESRTKQLENFHREFCALFKDEIKNHPPKDWSDAFYRLQTTIEKLQTNQKIILFFDELPWLAGPRSGFLAALDYFWNRHASRWPNVIVIICGSAASWMLKNVIHNQGGLHGRLSASVQLLPFNLAEVEIFLREKDILLTRKQVVELYLALGGVAKYLNYIQRGMSPSQIINELCFTSYGPLLTEFSKLYNSLFDSASRHIQICRTLASKPRGLTQKKLAQLLNQSQGGTLSELLNELEESGFIMSYPYWGKQVKDSMLRLSDEYSYFYLSWIEKVKSNLLRSYDPNYWHKMQTSQQWKIWSGYTFENICMKHIYAIKSALGLAAVSTHISHWQNQAAQIDLLIDRADNCINLCEIKFSANEFVVTKAYAEQLNRKKMIFQQATNTKKAIFTTLITPYGVKENKHYLTTVDHQLLLDDLFKEI